METFTKNTTIGELLSVYPECAPILMEIGMPVCTDGDTG